MRRPLSLPVVALLGAVSLSSCGLSDSRFATIWTDVPEIALYSELFNREQDRYRVEVIWKAELARDLSETKELPDLAIGHYLGSSLVRDRFRSLDYLFGELTVDQTALYPGLLSLGIMGGQQLLLPLSFNIPSIIFKKDGEGRPSDGETIDLDELSQRSAAFNRSLGNTYSRIGFSPRWNSDFLVLSLDALGAGFREGNPLAWSEAGLRSALDRLGSWGGPGNPKPTMMDDFQFKYLFTPPYTYIADERALYAYQSSADLFLIPEGKSAALDFRWFKAGSGIPLLEDLVFVGLPRSSHDQQAAEAFLGWLFKAERQQAMLEASRRTRALESSFGIAGGFSALREVTEKVFPLYYAALKGHVPPALEIGTPNILPIEWVELKTEVVSPWLRESLTREAAPPGQEGKTIDANADLSEKTLSYLKSGRRLH